MSPLPRRVLWGTAAGLSILTGAFALTLANGGGNAMAMDDSMSFRGPMGTVASVVGGAACVCAWLVVAVVVARRGMRHRPVG